MEEKIKRKTSTSKYVAAFSVTILIFIAGFAAGNALASLKLEEYKASQQSMLLDLMGLDLKEKLMQQGDLCSLDLEAVWEEKVQMGAKMDSLEIRFGKDDSEVLRQKELYHLIEIRTMMLIEEINSQCHLNHTILQFYYTNMKDDTKGSWKQCEDEGYALTTFGKKHPNTDVFVFDINIDNPALSTLKAKYNITHAPSIVYDGKSYSGFKDMDALEAVRLENGK